MEKQGTTHVTDIRDLANKAKREDRTLVVRMTKYDALVVVATGKRAQLLMKLVEEFNEL